MIVSCGREEPLVFAGQSVLGLHTVCWLLLIYILNWFSVLEYGTCFIVISLIFDQMWLNIDYTTIYCYSFIGTCHLLLPL